MISEQDFLHYKWMGIEEFINFVYTLSQSSPVQSLSQTHSDELSIVTQLMCAPVH